MTKHIDNSNEIDRRDFLRTLGKTALAGSALSLFPEYAKAVDADHHAVDYTDHRFWRRIRSEFVLDRRKVYMNVGTTGSTPRKVLNSYRKNNHLVAKDPWDMGDQFGDWPYTTEMADAIAGQFGADAGEIVLSRNTTDGMCTILGGLNLQPGDEVLMTHHEHVAATSPLSILAERSGVIVRELEIPVFPVSEDDFVQVFADAVTANTRLIVFSHITY
ncbi:MAG: aminotransferase class V-fold PLP-dependent enzyme, partial [Chromatiales bacterium]|nr:aminotransferase class V-fold PLP-dependent enzyme [Chromatiales bacterium]